MQIVHRISIASSPEVRRELASIGIVVGADGLVTFEFDEAHGSWPALERWIATRRPVDIVTTRFAAREIDGAKWLYLVPDWHWGYPQPKEEDFGYLEATYDLSDYCRNCGVGLKQKAPFQLKGEPKWGRNSILQLNWVFDEYFVTPKLWADVFQHQGIGYRPVLNRKLEELKTVVQLDIREEVSIITDGLAKETCVACGRDKYLPIARGYPPPLASEPSANMVRTKQYFGSGASAYHRVLMAQGLARTTREKKVRGASMEPIAARS
jgi:hypothetical protein